MDFGWPNDQWPTVMSNTVLNHTSKMLSNYNVYKLVRGDVYTNTLYFCSRAWQIKEAYSTTYISVMLPGRE